MAARIECFDKQLQQLRIHDQQFEKHAAQTIGFHEADELIQRHIGIRRARQPPKQERPKIAQHLAGPRRDMKTARALGQVRERFRRRLFITKDVEALHGRFRSRRSGPK